MERSEFIELIGSDLVVDYPFFGEVQKWSMKNFIIEDGAVKHNRLPINMNVFIPNARNPHIGEPTHG